MRRLLLGGALALSGFSFNEAAAWVNTPCCHYDWHLLADAEVSTGYRQDNLHWTIAGPTGTPNVLSELQWKGISSWMVKGQVTALWIDLIYVRASADYGWIFNGNNQDSDYAGDDRTLEFSRTKAQSDKGGVFDFTGGVGWQFIFPLCMCNTIVRVIPMIGYSYFEQQFRDRNGEILINSAFSELGDEIPLGPIGPVPGLHSNYRAKWRGAWLGADVFIPLSCDFELFGTFEYHRVKYHGTAHWNLRTDIVADFQQKAKKGHGYYASGGFKRLVCGNVALGFTGSYLWATSKHGTDTSYFPLGPVTTRFNGAKWNSWSVTGDITYTF